MTEFTEKRYSIDPGKGKKMPGCPYSIYEDGRDVKDYIIPPKGHVFVGFKYDPDASNQIYDGKLTAEYSKEPFLTRLKSNIWMLVLVLAIALVIGIVILLAFSVFKDPKPSTPKTKDVKPKTEITNNKKEKKEKKRLLSKPNPRQKLLSRNNPQQPSALLSKQPMCQTNNLPQTTPMRFSNAIFGLWYTKNQALWMPTPTFTTPTKPRWLEKNSIICVIPS